MGHYYYRLFYSPLQLKWLSKSSLYALFNADSWREYKLYNTIIKLMDNAQEEND